MTIKQQLNEIARTKKVPYKQVLTHYVMERFLYRLSRSAYADRLILKGGMLLMGMGIAPARTTMDIDLLGRLSNATQDMHKVVHDILHTRIGNSDGIEFSDSIHIAQIMKEALYSGVNVEVAVRVGGDSCTLSIDIGFSDIVHPKPNVMEYPVILPSSPSAHILCYPKEAIVAEKLESIAHLSTFNTRMKDFYDLWFLSQTYKFDFLTLKQSLLTTFQHRHTALSSCNILTDSNFISTLQPAWASYMAKLKSSTFNRKPPVTLPPKDLSLVIQEILRWIQPVLDTEAVGQWSAKSGWKLRKS